MITIRTPQEICDNIVLSLYDNHDNFIGIIDNELTCLDILAQTVENNVEGWYVIFKEDDVEHKYMIVKGKIKGFTKYNDTGLDRIMYSICGF